jgi:hypothetical protein
MSVFQRKESEETESKRTEAKAKEKADEMIESTPVSAGDPVVGAAVGSVLYSWFQFYVRNDSEKAMFVGLWAPTLLAAASYLQQKDIIRKFRQGLSSF